MGIKYVFNDTNRTYYPDFLRIDTRELFEVKPKKLLQIHDARRDAKIRAAQAFALEHGYTFKIIDESYIDGILPRSQRTRTNVTTLPSVELFGDRRLQTDTLAVDENIPVRFEVAGGMIHDGR